MKIDLSEIIRRAIKFIITGLAIAVCSLVLIKKKMDTTDIATLSLSAAAVFAIVDTFLPTIRSSLDQGAGLGLGLSLVM